MRLIPALCLACLLPNAAAAAPFALDGLALAAPSLLAAAAAWALVALMRRRARRAERRAAMLELALSGASTAILGLDSEGRVRVANAAARALFGESAAIGARADAALRPVDASAAPAALREVAAGPRLRGAEFLFSPGAAAPELRLRVGVESAPACSALAAVLSVEDVTEQHRARVLGDRAERLDALGKLTGGVAHDFNNLLSTILGAAQLAQRRAGPDESIRRQLDAVIRAARTGAALVDRLLGFAKRGSTALEATPVDALLDEAEGLASKALDPSIRLVVEHPPEPLTLRCDRAQLVTALLNLVINARDAIAGERRGGLVRIAVARDPAREGFAEISVIDDGPGMSEAVRARALDPFFTTKGPSRGTGLGLSMVYGAIRRIGGQMRIESAPGGGAAIRLSTPLAEAAGPSVEARAEPERRHGRGRVVLLVDDEADLLSTAAEMLRELGYAVVAAPNGAAALRELLSGRVVDVMITDILMPGGLDGPALAREARELRPNLPVILASGHASGRSSETRTEGALFVPKPYSMADLEVALAKALETRVAASALAAG